MEKKRCDRESCKALSGGIRRIKCMEGDVDGQ